MSTCGSFGVHRAYECGLGLSEGKKVFSDVFLGVKELGHNQG
jgi:hypothetical protein